MAHTNKTYWFFGLFLPLLMFFIMVDCGKSRKKTIDKTADLMTRYYVFPKAGKKMATHIRKKFKLGAYNKISSPKLLAEVLTKDLQSICQDLHLVVFHNPKRATALLKYSEKTEADLEELRKREMEHARERKFGFEKLELLPGNIGYLDLRFFADVGYATAAAEKAIAFLSDCDAVIIDLRKNHGGSPSMFTLLTSYFFTSAPVHLDTLYSRITDKKTKYYTLEKIKGKRMPDTKLYILTGSETFSAAEAFAYDLKHAGRAVVIGERTGGGAHMVDAWPINSELVILIPFARSINP
ncbi:MAG: S41 family peptidase, partial [bacterium]|nr:S41 family peptidase [bacterium]